MSPTFSSLSIYNYRVYFAGALVSNVGTWMGRVAQDWLVLTQLTDNDPIALGVVTGLQFAPMVLLAPWAGMVADRFRKRRILFATQSMLAVTSLLTGVLVVTGVVELWHVYLLALLQGLATAIDNPARQTFVSEMVPRTSLANAVSLNSASFNAARILGPGVAGLVIAAVGTGPAFFVNTLSFVAVLLALTQMKTELLRPAPRSRGKGQIRDGLRYVRRRPDLILIMVLVFVLGTFGMNFQLTTALMATQQFHKGAGEYGLLGSIMAIGSLSAALMSARRPRPRLRILLVALAGFVVASGAAAAGAQLPVVRGAARAGRAERADRAHQRELDGPARCRRAHARTGHGALHGHLHGRHAPRCAADRLDRRGLGPALDHPGGDHRRGTRPGRCDDLPHAQREPVHPLPAARSAARAGDPRRAQ